MGMPRGGAVLGLACMLAACAQPPSLEPNRAEDVARRVSEEALRQAQVPEHPTATQLLRIPSALMQGDWVSGYSAQQVRALSREYQYVRQGNHYFAFRRVGPDNEPVIVMQRGRPYRVTYVYDAPYYYYRLAPYYGQFQVPGGAQVIVTIQSYSYRPSVVRVRQDGRVTWVNQDTVAHTATSPLPGQVTTEGAWDLVMQPGQSASRRFVSPGRFEYACRFHPQMRGTVVVEAANVTP